MTFDTYLIRPQRVLAEQITEPGGRDVMSMGQTIHGNVTDWVIDDGGGFLTVMNNTDFVANYVLRSTIPGL